MNCDDGHKRLSAQYLEKRSDRAVTEALNAVYGTMPREGLIDPLLAQVQSASISRDA